MITSTLIDMPLGGALQKFLEPYGLECLLAADDVVITTRDEAQLSSWRRRPLTDINGPDWP
jgi:hypothetical protein